MLALGSARVAPSAAPAGPDALPARTVPEAVTREAPAELKLMVACVCESARAATNVGWITHDVREVADSTATIVSAVEALANTISELSASSTATSAEAQAVRVALRPRPIWLSRNSWTRSSNIPTNWRKPRSFSHPPQFPFSWRRPRTNSRRARSDSRPGDPRLRESRSATVARAQ